MNLKEQLFPDSNITGFTDIYNQPIMVGQKLKDETGGTWYVHSSKEGYLVSPSSSLENVNAQTLSLNLFVTLSRNLEIIE